MASNLTPRQVTITTIPDQESDETPHAEIQMETSELTTTDASAQTDSAGTGTATVPVEDNTPIDFSKLEPQKDPYLQFSRKKYHAYIKEKMKSSPFNYSSPCVINESSTTDTPKMDYKFCVEKMASNAEYPSTTHYAVPDSSELHLPSTKAFFDSLGIQDGKSQLGKPQKANFRSKHPVRHSVPHKGPGIHNLKRISFDGAYVRVAGIQSHLAYDLTKSLLPRWFSVMLDIQYYIDNISRTPFLQPEDAADQTRKWTTYLKSIVLFINLVDQVDTNIKVKTEKLIAQCQAVEKSQGIQLRTAVHFRAHDELHGTAGGLYETAINLYKFLKNSPKNASFERFIDVFNQLYVATATENVSYTKASNATNFVAGVFKRKSEDIKIEFTGGQRDFLLDSYVPQTSKNSVCIVDKLPENEFFKQMVTYISNVTNIRPNIFDILNMRVELNFTFLQCINPTSLDKIALLDIELGDRSTIKKTPIKTWQESTRGNVEEVIPKLNGFQYSVQYFSGDQRYCVASRYPQAPQLVMSTTSEYDVDISIEAAALPDGTIAVRPIAVRKLGGIIPDDPDNWKVLREMVRYIKITSTCSFKWPYNRPDGLILNMDDGSQIYQKKHQTFDCYYDEYHNSPGIVMDCYYNGEHTYIRNPWASQILVDHVKSKPPSYLANLKKIHVQRKQDKSWQADRAPVTTIMQPEYRDYLTNPGPYYPQMPNCYSLCISYRISSLNNQLDSVVPDIGVVQLLKNILSRKKNYIAPTERTVPTAFTKLKTDDFCS